MVTGNRYQKDIMRANHNNELTKNATGDTFLKKKKEAETIANTLTRIIIALISSLLIK
jgi:hypothetical protein